jgi:hypothetical protein
MAEPNWSVDNVKVDRVKADSHIPFRSHVVPMPFPCRSPAMPFHWGFRLCLSYLIYTVRLCLIHPYHAVPMPCHEYAFLKATSQGHGRVVAGWRHGMCELASAVQRRRIGDLPAFGVFRGVPGSFFYQKQTNLRCSWPVWNKATFVIILVQWHVCLCNLQHKHYDNNLVKDNCWKEIAGELQGSGRVVAGSRQGKAWERHGMCESAFNTAGERHGMCESAFKQHFS